MMRDFGLNTRMHSNRFTEIITFKLRHITGKNTINNNAPSPDRTNSDDSDNSEPESDSSTRLAFTRSVHNDSTNNNRNVSETQKRINDGEAADKEFKRVASNWIEFKPKHKKKCTPEKNLICTIMKSCVCATICGALT